MSEKSDFSYDVYNMLSKLITILLKNKTITSEEASTIINYTTLQELVNDIQKLEKK